MTALDTPTCYVTQCLGTAMEFRYLKPIFKSRQTTLGILGTISLGKKGQVYFLVQREHANLCGPGAKIAGLTVI